MQRLIRKGGKAALIRAFILVSAILAMVLLFSPVLKAEQSPLRLKSMKLSVWPEYDDPRILVMYEGEFASGPAFPQQVKFLAPKDAEISQVCALKKPSNEHECQRYEALVEGDYLGISYSLPIPTFFVEYYYAGLNDQTDRAFSYEFRAPYSIEKLEVEVQQPLRTSNFNLSPAYARTTSDAQGFKYYSYTLDNVAPGQLISFKASYTKTGAGPSVAKTQQNTPGGSSGGSGFPVALGVILAVALAGGGWYVLFRNRGPARRPSPVAASKRRPQTPASATETPRRKGEPQKDLFCSNCGQQLEQQHSFCPRCGTKARR